MTGLRIPGRAPAWLVVGVFALLAGRLLAMIDAHAVNVFFWDQWDLADAFFADAGFWEMFRWSHGPHRQGIAFPITGWLMTWTDWDSRADAFQVGVWILLAAALALALRRRLFGPLSPGDVAIPLLLLTPAQYGIFIHTPNASHGAAPLALLVAQALAWTLRDRRARLGAALLLHFALLHTGFGLFAGGTTLLLLAAEVREARGSAEPRALATSLAAVVLALAAIGAFFVDYHPDAAVDDFEFPSPLYPQYPRYMALMLANVLGLKGTGVLPTFAGFLALVLGGIAAGVHGARLFRAPAGDPDARRASAVIALLVVFSLLFCAGTAVGRISLGFNAAQSTRYVPLVVPFFLGLYLHLRTLEPPRLRGLASLAAVAVLVAASFPMRAPEASFMGVLADAKRRWADTYVRTKSIEQADRAAGRRIYHSAPETTRLQWKLDRLEERHLNLFAGRE